MTARRNKYTKSSHQSWLGEATTCQRNLGPVQTNMLAAMHSNSLATRARNRQRDEFGFFSTERKIKDRASLSLAKSLGLSIGAEVMDEDMPQAYIDILPSPSTQVTTVVWQSTLSVACRRRRPSCYVLDCRLKR